MPLSDPTGYVIFEAAYAYDPDHADEIQLRIGDRCWVQKPCAEPRGWLYGFNLSTRETGQFPGTYCHIFSADAGPPPIPPKPQARQNKIVLNGHMLQRFHNTMPIFCENCYDYIWGSSFDCIICTGCHLASHTNCHKLFEGGAGCPKTDAQVRRVPDEYKKPFHDWTNNDILVWVLAAHLHPYLLQIKASNIDGFRLLNMNRSQLQTYGVEFEPHQVSFLECITELKTQPKENFTNIDLREPPQHIGTHKMIEHTFTTRQQCNYCYKNMFGIIRQGIMCLDCGVQYHRSCAVYCAHPCPGNDVTRSRRASHSHDPSFCCNFNSVEIPPVMANCITAVTNAGLHTKNIYKSSGPYEGYRSLRVALNQDSRKVNMTNWSDPLSAASVLKTFLLELPEPLIPFDSYPSFLNLAYYEQCTDDDVMDMIHRQLPPSNREHLKHLIQHLINVAQYSNENGMTIEELAKVFSYLVLRPREKDGKIFTENLDVQILAFIRMVRACESHFGATSLAEDFDESKWLWPEATRKDVTMRLSGTPDGSFCIRQSERCRGEWTLTVRKEGRERLIRIIQRNQNGAPCFGFREELLNFGSLEDLVLHFRDNSLEDYNSKLNIKLLHPCGKPDQLNISEGQQDMLVDQARYEELVEKLNHIKFMELKLEEQQLALEECKTLVESQTDVVNFLEEQMELAERIKKEAPTSDKSDLENSIVSMKEFLNMEKAKWHEMDDMLTKLKQECDQISTQLTELSAGVPGLTDEYNQLERLLQKNDPSLFAEKHGQDGLEEKDMQKFEVIYDTAERYITNTDLQDNFWLFDTTNISRDRARDMLQGKPDGTFFVRSSSNYPYVISMVHNGQIKHIPILQDPNTFHYGFAPPHNIYPTLASLINHYHNQSLRMHNRTLDTTLAFPYGFLEQEEEPIYD